MAGLLLGVMLWRGLPIGTGSLSKIAHLAFGRAGN
jgi:hypothetical protein